MPLLLYLLLMESFTKLLVQTPEQNGVIERKYKHLVEIAHSLLLFASRSEFWKEAILATVHLINRILMSHNSSLSHFTMFYRYVHDYFSLCVFGSTC